MTGLPDLRDFRSVLIVKPSSLGDIVHTLPAVHLIRTAHPHLKIRWIANPEWLPLIDGASCVDETIPFPRKSLRGVLAPFKYLRWAPGFRALVREEPEIVLDFQGLLRSAFIARARGAAEVVGLSDSREGARYFCHHVVQVDPASHAVDRYLAMPEAFGIMADRRALHWPLPEGIKPKASLPDSFVLVHPWSRGKGKTLSRDALAVMLEALAPANVLLVGVTAEQLGALPSHVTDLSNKTTLAELIWLMRRARCNISVDSGPMHIAAAVNDRTLGLHTWSDPRKVGPYNPNALVWKAGRIAHRAELSASECKTERDVLPEDAITAVSALRERHWLD